MQLSPPRPHLPLSLIGPFKLSAKAKNLPQRLEALRILAEAKIPSWQDIDAERPDYRPGISRLGQHKAQHRAVA